MLSTAPVVDSINTVESIDSIPPLIEVAEIVRDWPAFKTQIAVAANILDADMRLTTRRRAALAYLGKRAQAAGGVYNSTAATVFTGAFIELLGDENRQRRHRRYPWLADLLAIMEALERDQYTNGSVTASVISFPSRKAT